MRIIERVQTRLANENQIVCAEDLDVKSMLSDHRLAKSISDASWSELLRKLEYKMADRGGMLIKVPGTYPSSQRCSCCGARNMKQRSRPIKREKKRETATGPSFFCKG